MFDPVPVVNAHFGLGGDRSAEMVQPTKRIQGECISVTRPYQALGTKIQGRKGEIPDDNFSVQLSLAAIYGKGHEIFSWRFFLLPCSAQMSLSKPILIAKKGDSVLNKLTAFPPPSENIYSLAALLDRRFT